jgi:hypothetical protein
MVVPDNYSYIDKIIKNSIKQSQTDNICDTVVIK